MTFAAPLALCLLAAVPLAWWVHRARRSAQVVRVASLAAFRTAGEATPSSAPRRAADVPLILVLTAMALLALAAAGPEFGVARVAAFYVVVDRSASMTARTCDAERRAVTVLSDAEPAAERLIHVLARTGGEDGLPLSVASHLSAAREQGFQGIVLVTDSLGEPADGVAIVGPSAGARTNVSLVSAVLDGADALVTLRNFGPEAAAVSVTDSSQTRETNVPARGIAASRFPAPASGAAASFRITSPNDDLAIDDELRVRRGGGARRVRLHVPTGGAAPRLSVALRAAGAEIVDDGERDADVSYGGPLVPPRDRPLLIVAPARKRSTADRPATILLATGPPGGRVTGASVAGRSTFGDVLPPPGVSLSVSDYLSGGEAVWNDANGVLAARDSGLFVLAADPESASSDWHLDPSFAVFVAAALDDLTDGPDRLVAEDVVPASESDVVHDPPRTSSREELLSVMRPRGAASDAARPAPMLALAAGLLLAAAAALHRR